MSATGTVCLLRRPDDFLLPSPKRSPLVKPGRYVGATTAVKKYSYKGARDYLVLSFDLFDSAEAMGTLARPLARAVPYFISLNSLGPRSKYARLLAILFPDRPEGRASSELVGALVEVEVETVMTDAEQEDLPEGLHYSRVARVLARA